MSTPVDVPVTTFPFSVCLIDLTQKKTYLEKISLRPLKSFSLGGWGGGGIVRRVHVFEPFRNMESPGNVVFKI